MSTQVTEFVVGEKYTNDQIRFALDLENLGGIRPAVDGKKNLRHLAIMTAAHAYEKNIAENPYNDRIENGILTYTAQGRRGDQEITGRNRRILEQYSTPCPFYCFSNEGRQVYTFLGLLELLRHYQERQIDSKSELRLVWVFEFRIHNEVNVVPLAHAMDLTATFLAERESITPEEREIVDLEPDIEIQQATGLETEQIRSRLIQINPYRFELLVKDIVERRGFENVTVTRASQDGGIDLDAYVCESDYFFSRTHVQFQVKRWRHSIGSVDINNFRGALSATAKGVFVTTSHFTRAAVRESQHQTKPAIALLDGLRFSQLIQEVGLDLTVYG